jgi:glyoxylase-like metal-dependent hydrolase (beta-lactamase superfamily II)
MSSDEKARKGMTRRDFFKGAAVAGAAVASAGAVANYAASANAQAPGSLKSVYAVKYAEGAFPEYGVFWMSNPKFSIDQPRRAINMYFWLIQTGDHNILVDTGTGKDFSTRYPKYVSPVDLLSKVGLKPSDIDIIIVSHPHFDHIDGLELFKDTNPIVYIQRDSYRFMVEEGPESSIIRKDGLFPRKKDAAALLDLAWEGKLKILDGDTEIVPGINTIKVGGHFPGLQITVVPTGAKPVILASDSVHQYDNLEKNIGMGLFQGSFKDMTKAYDTIRQLNGVVVAGHDKQVLERFKPVQEGIVQIYPY